MTNYVSSFPKPLLDDLVLGRWLPIVGAGLSRNATVPSGDTIPLWNELGEHLANELVDYSFYSAIDAISAFEYEYGRPKLVERLIELLLVHESRPGLAHHSFCSIPFDIVVTTNFDFLLERAYDATPWTCTPLIDEDQLAVNLKNSAVGLLKLHGDLHHPTRLVATEGDYDVFLSRYPMLATYLSNLLITRTGVLVGYSLDDPDFRQLWQVIGERLGSSRRLAYAIMVGAKPADVARFDRRGVKVINLPGSRKNYADILKNTFDQLRDYVSENVIAASHVTEEDPLRELSLPRDASTRLCFFAIPLALHPFYREHVFPIVRNAGLVPVAADDVVLPGDNWLAKVYALLERSFIVVVDASTEFALAEFRMAVAAGFGNQVVLISEHPSDLPIDLEMFRAIRRPNVIDDDPTDFLNTLREFFDVLASDYAPTLRDEPQRLLESKEYRAAAISAITLLESSLRRRFGLYNEGFNRDRSLRSLLAEATRRELINKSQSNVISSWIRIRNDAVHANAKVTRADAIRIVQGVDELLNGMR